MIKNNLFRVVMTLLFLTNIAYITIETLKFQKSDFVFNHSTMTEAMFAEITTLSNYLIVIESIFFLFTLVGIVLLCNKVYRSFAESYFFGQFIVLVVLFLINTIVAWIFHIPMGNIVQLLYAPLAITFVIVSYLLIHNYLMKQQQLDSANR